MSAGWVAATVRGRALLRGTLGAAGAHEVATADSWPTARARLGRSGYGARLDPDADRAAARRTAQEATLWQLRVLAGWLPPDGAALARVAAGPLEIANLEGQLARLTGGEAAAPLPLGSLGAAWPRAGDAATADRLRRLLTASVWGDPGGTDRPAFALGLRVAWAGRVAREVPLARPWARSAAALLVAREQQVFGRPVAEPTARQVDRLLGRGWRAAGSLPDLVRAVPEAARPVFVDVSEPAELWRAELALARRVASEALPVARSGRYGHDTVGAVVALMLVDLWRTLAAVEAAGRGAPGVEVVDALAS